MVDRITDCRLGSFPLLASRPIEWRFTAGTRPYLGTFDMMADDAQALVAQFGPLQLEMQTNDQSVQVENLWALHVAPSPDEFITTVVVADRRWMWEYAWIAGRFNLRRKFGERRLAAPDQLPQIQQTGDDVQYAPFSLKNGQTAWRTSEVLKYVLDQIVEKEEELGGVTRYKISGELEGALDNVPLEDFELDDNGSDALNRILAYVPEGAVYVNRLGNVQVYSRADGEERELIGAARAREIQGTGHIIANATYSNIRPSAINVYFTREIEVRFDGKEPDSVGATSERGRDERFMQNVLPSPDYQIEVGGVQIPQGTWLPFDVAMRAWNRGEPKPPGPLSSLDIENLRRMMVPYNDLWLPLGLTGQVDPNADWAARISTLQTYWRRAWQINRRWMDRIFSIRPYRVATLDPTTGARAPAAVYSDYCMLNGQRALLIGIAGGGDQSYIINVRGLEGLGAISEGTKTAPALMTIADGDQGILTLEYRVDPYRISEQVMPGIIEVGGRGESGSQPTEPGPWGDLTDRSRTHMWDSVVNENEAPAFRSGHEVSIITTCIPGAPNNKHQFQRVKVRPEEIQEILASILASAGFSGGGQGGAGGPGSQTGLAGRGPEMDIHVPGTVETARIAWNEQKKDVIERLFGVSNTSGGANTGEQETEDLSELARDLIVNFTEEGEGGAQAGSINQIAKAVAARVYAAMSDRVIGSTSIGLTTNLEPGGWLTDVAHRINPNGSAMTTLGIQDRKPMRNLFALLPAGTRKLVMRLVTPKAVS